MAAHTHPSLGQFTTHGRPSLCAREQLVEQLFPHSATAHGLWLLLAPHPDDETISAGWLLGRTGDLKIAYVTDGAPQDAKLWTAPVEHRAAYGVVRRREVLAALELAGIGPENVHGPWVCDQSAAVELVRLTQTLVSLIEKLEPSLLIVPPYEGGHPDHDACAFIAQAAELLLQKQGKQPPARMEMSSYHRGGSGIVTGCFLSDKPPCVRHTLSADEREHKRAMLNCFESQRETLAPFSVDVECFRRAPSYDFGRAPHAGTLHYETLPFGFDAQRWRELATNALVRLGLSTEATP